MTMLNFPQQARVVAGKPLGMGVENEAAASFFFRDTFTDTDTTALASHTPAPFNQPAASWTVHKGTATITGNRVAVTTGARGCASVDLGVADCSCSVDATTKNAAGEAGPHGLAVRVVDQDNQWAIGVSKDANQFRIVQIQAGVPTIRASIAFTVNINTTYAIAVTLSGNTITATIDGGNQISYASATFQNTATRHGITWNEVGGGNQTAYFDNFYRTDL